MAKIIFSSILLMLYLTWSKSFGFVGARVIAISASQHSLVLGAGLFKGKMLGEHYSFYKSISKNVDKPRYQKLGSGEIIKISEDKSFVYFKDGMLLDVMPKEIIYYSPDHLLGRSELSLSHTEIVLLENQDSFNNVPNNLKKELIADYNAITVDLDANNINSADVKITRIKKYKKWPFKSVIGKTAVDIYRPEDLGNVYNSHLLKTKIKKSIIKSEQDGIVSKLDRQKYGLYGMYDASIRDGRITTSLSGNVYEQYRADELIPRKGTKIGRSLQRFIKKNGARYTKGMDDKNLRRHFIKSGIHQELSRQTRALSERSGNELHLTYINGLTNNTTTLDPINQGLNFALALSYEFHLINIRKYLARFSIQAGLLQEITNYDLNGINGRFSEGNFEMYLNWYYKNSPELIEEYIPYLSLGFKRGSATVSSGNLVKDYKYQIVGLPSIRLGFKYRYKAGDTREDLLKLSIGLNFFLESTKKYLAVAEDTKENIYGTMSFNEYRVGMGFSVYY